MTAIDAIFELFVLKENVNAVLATAAMDINAPKVSTIFVKKLG